MGKTFLKALTKSWHYAQSSDAQDNKLSFNKKAFKDKKKQTKKKPAARYNDGMRLMISHT